MAKKLTDFRLATAAEIAAAEETAAAEKTMKGSGLRVLGAAILTPLQIPERWEPVDPTFVYMVMDQTFGPPNAQSFDPTKITWRWIIFTSAGLLSVYDWKYGWWSIGYWAIPTDRPSTALIEQAEALRAAIVRAARKIHVTKADRKNERIAGHLRNPYAMYTNTAEALLEQAERSIELLRLDAAGELDADDFDWIAEHGQVAALYRSAFTNVLLSMEGFVNLIYTLFLKQRYRSRQSEGAIRAVGLQYKLEDMDVYCHSFKWPPLENGTDLHAAIMHLISLRNHLVHAGINDAMEQHIVKKNGYILRVGSMPEPKFGIPADISSISNVHIILAARLVRKVVLSILKSLKTGIRRDFINVHALEWIYYEMPSADTVRFDWPERDTLSDKQVASILRQSTKLDSAYWRVRGAEFVPQFQDLELRPHPLPVLPSSS
jgi:hypothetical protein